MYRWLNEESQTFLERGYLLEGQSVDDRVRDIAYHAESILKITGYAEKFIDQFSKGWFSLSTPIWANFGNERGLPISCFGSHISDSTSSILDTVSEVGMMTKHGGGTSGYFGEIRPRGSEIRDNGTSSGSVHFMKLFESLIDVISQGKTRKGSFHAAQLITHMDIMEFLQIRSDGNPLQELNPGVIIPEGWMQSMISGDSHKREIWAKVISSRVKTGFPYIFFADNVNANTVDVYRDKGLYIHHSNLCQEICLPNSETESFVCDLSSMNIRYFDEWKNTDVVKTVIFLLDAVMTEFIEKAQTVSHMHRAVRFAERHRALGLGWLGWHSYLQSKMVPFESLIAKSMNVEVAKNIQENALLASQELAHLYGEPSILKGYGRRNTTLTAIAPTKSSSFILGQTSEGIEPRISNYFIEDKAKGRFTTKNPELAEFLSQTGNNTPGVWDAIRENYGSVSNLDFFSDHEKAVFKTFLEISPRETILQAAARQKYIDQSQSLNLIVDPRVPIKELNQLMIESWSLGIKTLYYHKSVNAAQQLSRSILTCESCEA